MAMQRLSPSRGQCSLSPTHSHGVLGIMRRRDGAGLLLQHLVQGKTAHVHVLLFSEDDQVSLDVHCALRSSLPSHGHVELHGPVYRRVFSWTSMCAEWTAASGCLRDELSNGGGKDQSTQAQGKGCSRVVQTASSH